MPCTYRGAMNLRATLACAAALLVAALRGFDEFFCLQRTRLFSRRLR